MTHNHLHWEQVLWNAGHRVTRQRSLILDAVCAAQDHTSLGEIYARVRKQDRSIDRSTVYRALHLFVDLGLVVVADTGAGEPLYEVRHPEPHHHLACRACGRVEEIDPPLVDEFYAALTSRHAFRPMTDHLVISGYCSACSKGSDS